MTDRELEAMLEETFDQLPPQDDVVEEITPWKKAMNRVLWGLGLCTLTLNFWMLNYILPAIGMILMVLGFRALRRENRWMTAAYAVALIRCAYMVVQLFLDSTIWGGTVSQLALMQVLRPLLHGVSMLQILCLWRGLRLIRQKAGLEPGAASAFWLLVWWIVMTVLGLAGFTGILVWALLLCYFLIFRGLVKLSRELDNAGYAVEPAPVKIPDGQAKLIFALAVAIAMGTGFLFFRQYPMNWEPAEPRTSKVQQVRTELLVLGFPEIVLDDLTEEEILSLEGALDVVTSNQEHAVGKERLTLYEQQGKVSYYYSNGDNNLTITDVAVKLPTQRETWRIIQHFHWTIPPEYYGTESIEIWRMSSEGWHRQDNWAGRVLYNREGTAYAAPYYSLGRVSYTQNSIFWGQSQVTSIFAAFSLPKGGSDYRGYVWYDIQEQVDGYIVDEWINYTHNTGPWQFPVQTAMEHEMTAGMFSDGPFTTAQDAIQFYAHREDPEPLS